VRGRGRPRVVGPRMPGISTTQFFPDLRIGRRPEAPEVARGLHRAAVRGQQREGHRHTAWPEARRVGQAEQLLQFDGGMYRAVCPVVESRRASARQRHGIWCTCGHLLAQRPRRGGLEVDVFKRRCLGGRLLHEHRDVSLGPDKADALEPLQGLIGRRPAQPLLSEDARARLRVGRARMFRHHQRVPQHHA